MTIKQKTQYKEHYNITNSIFKDIDNVILIKKTSTDASIDIKDNFLDWVYIDGDHRFKHVLNDLTLWYNKVKKGGIIAGHDYTHADIRKAINIFLKNNTNCKLICSYNECGADGNSDFMIIKN
mgnify:CR=1 FL=1|jgi:hypothetical protein